MFRSSSLGFAKDQHCNDELGIGVETDLPQWSHFYTFVSLHMLQSSREDNNVGIAHGGMSSARCWLGLVLVLGKMPVMWRQTQKYRQIEEEGKRPPLRAQNILTVTSAIVSLCL